MGIFSHCVPLVKILLVIKSILPEPNVPKRRGRPFVYTLPIMMCCFVIMVAKHLSVRGLHAYLTRDDPDAQIIKETIAFPDQNIPDRRTFDRRLSRWKDSAMQYVQIATVWFISKKLVGIARLVTDRRMFQAFGKLWHAKDKKAGRIPPKVRNIDKDASWQKSYYRGWVFGHGLDVFVSIGKLVLPVLADAGTLANHDNMIAKQLVQLLPHVSQGTLGADSTYQDAELAMLSQKTGRVLKAATRKGIIPKGRTYQRRKVTVEPFFERLLLAFPHLRYHLPLKGETRVAGYLLTAVFAYQCAVILRVLEKKPPLEVTHFFHFL